ncbi:SDR family NAD(P)-dependent oxidoreductase [Pseudonocardia alni]|uniref:SDR family NAD(P)-dependent oxidoreductase n=1 Tax=Pseudonocardia alni TaxID=33907 RepID=UPI0033DE95F2
MSVLDTFDLTGRTALVTGGNRGLGKAFTAALAQAGARVAFVARDADRNLATVAEFAESGLKVESITADITDPAGVELAITETVGRLGRLDVLVNNAGTCFHNASFDATDDEWDAVFDLNVTALWRCCRAAGRVMREQGGGSIVNVGSMSGLIVNRPQWQAPYNASKAAVHHLTKSLAAEWAPHGIRVNAVAPGYVKTEMAPVDRPDLQRYWIEDAPQQRYALPEEIAPGVLFLAADASSFVTGSVVVMDGGYTTF